MGPVLGSQTKFIDLFCGVGGFRIAAQWLDWECVFSCDIDKEAWRSYLANFGDEPAGDIRCIDAQDIPDHDVLFAGFPCQPFSIIGPMHGTSDERGDLFHEILRILREKTPTWFVLENVKQLISSNRGVTLDTILESVRRLGYQVEWRVLNALEFGLPQKRERIFIVGNNRGIKIRWPAGSYPMKPLANILEPDPPIRYFVSERIEKNAMRATRARLRRQSGMKIKLAISVPIHFRVLCEQVLRTTTC